MKKKFGVLLVIATFAISLVFGGQVNIAEAAGNNVQEIKNVTIFINGEKVTFKDPVLTQSEHLLLPMRAFYEALGASVTWNSNTKIAGASLNGMSLDLTLDSKIANVNGNNVSMTVPALAYKERIYVPLRFVGENLDGSVYWTQQEKRVDIIMNTPSEEEEPTPPEDPYIFHINNIRVEMTDPIITKQGRNYIPAEYFYNYIINSSGNWISENGFELNVGGNYFTFYTNSNNAYVNGYFTSMDATPFVQNGKMYVPVHFIVDNLGGSLRYQVNNREMYVYLDNYLFTSPFLQVRNGYTMVPEQVPSATLVGSRDLLVSDNPERLTHYRVPENESTLSMYHVQTAETKKEHRVFGWHLNEMNQRVTVGITIENTSSTTPIEITNSKGISSRSETSRISYEIGLTIADAAYNNKLKNSSSKGAVIQPGETILIESNLLDNGRILGFLHDLDIRSVNGGEMDYKIRTVLSKTDGDLTLINTDPVQSSSVHPRGAWESSTIFAEFPEYTIGDPQVGYSISNGITDHLLTAESSLSQVNGTIGNVGHFGMDYKVSIPIVNPTESAKTVTITLSGRGGIYSGAVKLNGQVYLVPDIKPGVNYAELPPITINTKSKTIELEIMHAGGVNLPLGIYVEGN